VSLLRVDWAEKRLQLQAQWSGDGGRALPKGFEQSVERGIIGAVVRAGEALYIPDVGADPRYVSGALDAGMTGGSEFCWPVFYDETDRRVAWVFNIEDKHVDSLSERAQDVLAELAEEVGGLLQRMNDLSYLKAAFASTSDPVVIIDEFGEVKKVNPAASRLFAVEPPGHLKGNFREYLGEEPMEAIFAGGEIVEAEMLLRIIDSAIPVLLSSCSMPESLGGKVLLIKDLRPIRRMEELKYLGKVSQEVALQAQTPLALASTWLARLRRSLRDASKAAQGPVEVVPLADLADRIAPQLRRMQLALTRLSLYDQTGAFSVGNPVPVDLRAELEAVVTRLPQSDRERIDVAPASDTLEIRGNPIHCAFVLETCLAFLLRHLPDGRKVRVSSSHDKVSGCIEFHGDDASVNPRADAPRTLFATQLADKLGLAEGTLRSIVAGFDGTFERSNQGDGSTVLTIRAPLAPWSQGRG
jgi:PAS domain-containing protein